MNSLIKRVLTIFSRMVISQCIYLTNKNSLVCQSRSKDSCLYLSKKYWINNLLEKGTSGLKLKTNSWLDSRKACSFRTIIPSDLDSKTFELTNPGNLVQAPKTQKGGRERSRQNEKKLNSRPGKRQSDIILFGISKNARHSHLHFSISICKCWYEFMIFWQDHIWFSKQLNPTMTPKHR